MKINWEVRLHNPVWWGQLILAIVTPVFAALGLSMADITTWTKLLDVIKEAVSNPAIVVAIVVSVINIINDPTTAGVSDSDLALTYTEPRKSE